MTPPRLFCIILSWNGKALTLDCVRSVLRSGFTDYTIVLVDNHSDDQTAEAIRQCFVLEIQTGKIVLIENDQNLGFAGGNNVGMRYAMEQNADYIFLLNNDTVIDSGLFENLILFMEMKPEAGITGPKIYYFEPSNQIWFAGGEIHLHKGVSRHTGIRCIDQGQFEQVAKCDYVTGCAMMIRRSVIEKCGFLDTTYPLYSEDADYCMRANKAGFQCYYYPKGKVWHKISAGSGGQLKWNKIRLRLKSGLIFYRRYAKWYHWLTIPVFQIIETVRVLLLVVFRKIKNN